jgi:hypothetical protein
MNKYGCVKSNTKTYLYNVLNKYYITNGNENWTYVDAAALLKIDKNTVSKLCRGLSFPRKRATLNMIADLADRIGLIRAEPLRYVCGKMICDYIYCSGKLPESSGLGSTLVSEICDLAEHVLALDGFNSIVKIANYDRNSPMLSVIGKTIPAWIEGYDKDYADLALKSEAEFKEITGHELTYDELVNKCKILEEELEEAKRQVEFSCPLADHCTCHGKEIPIVTPDERIKAYKDCFCWGVEEYGNRIRTHIDGRDILKMLYGKIDYDEFETVVDLFDEGFNDDKIHDIVDCILKVAINDLTQEAQNEKTNEA